MNTRSCPPMSSCSSRHTYTFSSKGRAPDQTYNVLHHVKEDNHVTSWFLQHLGPQCTDEPKVTFNKGRSQDTKLTRHSAAHGSCIRLDGRAALVQLTSTVRLPVNIGHATHRAQQMLLIRCADILRLGRAPFLQSMTPEEIHHLRWRLFSRWAWLMSSFAV